MSSQELPREVKRFKEFVQEHPRLVEAVKNKEYTWQQLYDLWNREGEEALFWEAFDKEINNNNSSIDHGKWMKQTMDILSNVDLDKLDHQIRGLSKAIDQLQDFVQSSKRPQSPYHRRTKRF
ncbi:hypothetical protein CEY16_01785 [Halalkalibacillus sediminis]|uniref:Cytosolic protein n=1 Tax=Halalkalibacillus sediminis TaxID=2018042 RepID=A0A2I0QVZ3_9BACI|nr:spore coat protein YlbD [Halalkalibacillus sediminis]PKR78511.1 hypothetical protein CEY16_01785 [Halalkalibacillus sediminis]